MSVSEVVSSKIKALAFQTKSQFKPHILHTNDYSLYVNNNFEKEIKIGLHIDHKDEVIDFMLQRK